MNSLQSAPTFTPPSSSYNYLQPWYAHKQASHEKYFTRNSVIDVWYLPKASDRIRYLRENYSRSPYSCCDWGYSPAPRLPPRMGPPPPYYDYDYGYGGGYGYGGYGGYGGYRPYGGYGYGYAPPPPPLPRYRGYDPYLDEDYDLSYVPRYRPRISDALLDIEKDKLGGEGKEGVSTSRKTTVTSRPKSLERKSYSSSLETERDSRTGRTRYNALSEPQMLQDQVDKMRTRLQAMTFSLDPSGPVPEIIIPERSRRVDSGKDFSKKYTSAFEMAELPRLSARKHHRQYPEDDYMKDNLRIKCLSHYKTTRSAAEYWKPKGYYGDELSTYTLPNYSSKYSKKPASEEGQAKWEEPDTVYSSSTLKENKPFSKVETGSSFFSTHGYTNRKKDTVLKKVHDYYYEGDATTSKSDGISSVRFADTTLLQSGEGDDDDDLRKDRRKKKRSKERDDLFSTESDTAPVIAPEKTVDTTEEPSVTAVSAGGEATSVAEAPAAAEDAELDEKEKKKLEKKKRKAEREAAAKAAMEAELAALAEAEAELARLEAESSIIKSPTEAASKTDAKTSDKPAEKCESPIEAPCEVLPECPPTQFEPEPSTLFPSSPDDIVEEPVQGKVEEPEEEPQQIQHEFFQDVSAEVEPEPAEQVNEDHYEPQVNEVFDKDAEKEYIYSDENEPKAEEETDYQFPIYKTEARLSDEPNEEADTEQTYEAPHRDDFSQPIGSGGGGEEDEEGRGDAVGVKEDEEGGGGAEGPWEDVVRKTPSPPSSPPQQPQEQEQPLENTQLEQQQTEETNWLQQDEQQQQQQQFDEDVDIFAGRED